MSSSTHPSVDIKFDFVPFNGTPGETYDKWERALLNAGARADEREYSISDRMNGTCRLVCSFSLARRPAGSTG